MGAPNPDPNGTPATLYYESACLLVDAPYNGENLMEDICELEAEVYQLDLYANFYS